MSIKQKLSKTFSACGNIHPLCFVIPAALLLCALVIRLFSGGTVIVYNAARSTGIFPGPFFYTVGYALRIAVAGFLAAAVITDARLYENKAALVIMSCCACILLLFEYKLIFVSLRLVLALLLSILCAVLFLLAAVKISKCRKTLIFTCLAATALQIIFCIRLISLIFCV